MNKHTDSGKHQSRSEAGKVSFQIQPNWKLILLVCAIIPLTIGAGLWQVDRAAQKRATLVALDQAAEMPHRDLWAIDEFEKNFQRVYVEGEWSEQWFLLDNRIRSGRIGYEVLGVLRSEGRPLVLVNRGWVIADPDRDQLPEIYQPSGIQRIEGYLYRASQKPLVLDRQHWQNIWPERIQTIDFDLLEARLGEMLFPATVRIDPRSALAFRADWVIGRKGPGMHIGYALQWFAMAATVLILAVFANTNLWSWLRARRSSRKAFFRDDST